MNYLPWQIQELVVGVMIPTASHFTPPHCPFPALHFRVRGSGERWSAVNSPCGQSPVAKRFFMYFKSKKSRYGYIK